MIAKIYGKVTPDPVSCQIFFPGTHFAQEKSAHHFHYVCVNGNSNTSFYTMRVIASPTTTFCLVKPVSVPGVRPETTLNNFIPPSLKRLLERFTIFIRLCDEDVPVRTYYNRRYSVSPSCLLQVNFWIFP